MLRQKQVLTGIGFSAAWLYYAMFCGTLNTKKTIAQLKAQQGKEC